MKLRFLKGRYRGRIVDVDEDRGLTIGRAPDNDLALDEEGISRYHCRIYKENDQWWVEDVKSTNGVRVNGEWLEQPRRLTASDRVGLYNQTFIFADAESIVDLPDGEDSEPGPGETAKAEPMAAPMAAPTTAPEAVTAGGAVGEPDGDANRMEPVHPGFPWGHLLLLIGVAVAFVWFIILVLSSPPPEEEQANVADSGDTVVQSQEQEAPGMASDLEDGEDDLLEDGLMPDAESPEDAVASRQTEPEEGEEEEEGGDIPLTEAGGADRAVPPAAVEVADGQPREGAEEETPPVAVVVHSDPPGAVVLLDDEHQGVTPLVLEGITAGRHVITLTRNGYEDVVRQIYHPGMLPDRPYSMRLQPGVVRITSNPGGATLVHGSQIIGQTPLLVTDLPAGQYEMRLVSYGYEPQKVTVEVSDIRGREFDHQLVPTFGGIEVMTLPAGFEVHVDDFVKGLTKSAPDTTPKRSLPLVINGLKPGRHVVRVQHASGPQRSEAVTVKAGEVTPVSFRMWIPDTTVVLTTGAEKHGMLLSRNEHGDVILAEPQTKNYFKEQIKQINTLTPDRARQLLEERGELDDRSGTAGDTGQPQGGEENALRAPWELPEREVRPPAAGTGPAADDIITTTAQDITFLMKNETVAEMVKRFGEKTVVVTGIPTSIRSNALEAIIHFGTLVRCSMDRQEYDRHRAEIRFSESRNTPLTLKGIAIPRAHAMLLRSCEFVPPERE